MTIARYDGTVVLMNEDLDTVEVPLNSKEQGPVAVICKLDNSRVHRSAKLVNLNKILTCREFMAAIPGADTFVRLKNCLAPGP